MHRVKVSVGADEPVLESGTCAVRKFDESAKKRIFSFFRSSYSLPVISVHFLNSKSVPQLPMQDLFPFVQVKHFKPLEENGNETQNRFA